MLERLKVIEFVKLLKEKAKLNKDAGAWADYIVDNDEEPGPRAILQAVSVATFDQLMAEISPLDAELNTEPVKTWLRKLYDELKAIPMDEPGEGGA